MAAEKPFAFGSVRFEENRGQADASVAYLARARGQQVFLTADGAVFAPPGGPPVRMRFRGAGKSRWTPEGAAADSISYYIGNNPAKWIRQAPVYNRVVWHEAYAGVDVAFHGDGERLEYDLVLAPGADPSLVRIRFDRPAKARVAADGTVEIASGGNVVRQHAPRIWQEIAGERNTIEGRFVADGANGLRLALSAYEPSKGVVVDPDVEMATYVGGENDDEVVAITDGAVAGNTRSVFFPPASPGLRSSRNVFVRGTGVVIPGQISRNTLTGTIVIGGSADSQLAGLAAATISSGYYLAGTTASTDFPVVGASASKYFGGASDGFVAFVGTASGYPYLGLSFFVGGSGEDRINSFAGNGTTFALAGSTDSPDLPVANVPQTMLAGGKDAFFGILSPFYSTAVLYGYLGGSGNDVAYAVAVQSGNQVWIGGQTSSADFPFASGALSGPSDGFLAEVTTRSSFFLPNPTVAVTAWQIGGSGDDSIRALEASPSTMVSSTYAAIPISFRIYGIGFAGVTTSPDLPVASAAQSQPGGGEDGFVGMWDPTAAAPRWFTYLGGSGTDEATAITEDWAGDLYVGGWTASSDLPVVNALQPANAGGEDGMLAIFDYNGGLQHLTYYGGSGNDRVEGVGLVYNYLARLVGSTTSTDLPVTAGGAGSAGAVDGFMADIGSDFFLGPTNLILAKDGLLGFSLRAGRTAFRPPVTYQSSDPSRVRLVYYARSFDQVTAAPEDNIGVEGLADNGSADILISSPGFAPKTVHVSLYPGAIVPFSGASSPYSTWNPPPYLYYSYCAIDPAANAIIGPCMSVRYGIPAPVVNWSVSDPGVFQILYVNGLPQLQPIQAGTATLTATADGYTVFQGSQTITAVTPQVVPPPADFHLGQDLMSSLPIDFAANGNYVSGGYKGTLTARSSDPSRLLLSVDPTQPGADHVSLTMSASTRTPPLVYAQALAGDGTVQVFVSASGTAGEIPINVVLEPAVLGWGVLQYVQGVGNQFASSIPLTVGANGTGLALSFHGVSGGFASLRPGVTPPVLTLSNSDPTVVELNRLTLDMANAQLNYSLLGIAPGTANLTLSSSSPNLQPVPPTLPVNVQKSSILLPTFPSAIYAGNGLQASLQFRYDPAGPVNVTVSVDDPSLAVISNAASVSGTDHLTIAAGATFNDQYTFYVQGRSSSGATTLRISFPEGERDVTVNLLPSGVGFNYTTGSVLQGYSQEAYVVAFALDRNTGIGVFQQTPVPGPGITVHFSADPGIQLNHTSAVLTSGNAQAAVDLTLPPAGQQATLTVSADGASSVSPLTSTLKLGSTSVPTGPIQLTNVILAHGELRVYSLSIATGVATITSSDPRNVLVSALPTDPGATSIALPKGAQSFYIHALGDSGVYNLTLDSPGGPGYVIQVGLQPLQLGFYGSVIPLGGSSVWQVQLNAYTLRPGFGPLHFTVQSSNPAVAAVTPAAFDMSSASTALTVSGISPGSAQLTITGPPDVYIVPPAAIVTVGPTPAPVVLPAYSLGLNLEGAAQIDLGASFSNPNGTIVTLTSSDPTVLLLSRAATTVGTASVVVAVPAGSHQTQPVYLQGLALGNAGIQVTVNGSAQAAATVTVTPSWVSCGSKPITLAAGATSTLYCYVYSSPPAFTAAQLQSVAPRPGLANTTIALASSAPGVFTVTPATEPVATTSTGVTLRAIAPGTGVLHVTAPDGFGPSPDGSESVTVTVTKPSLTTNCSQIVVGRDTQVTCNLAFGAAAGTATATSGDPSLLLVSSDPNTPGAASATVAPNGQTASMTIQGLAGYGTVEVLITAPGYQDLRIPVILRPASFSLDLEFVQSPIALRVGNIANLSVTMRTGGAAATPRAGANIPIDLVADQAGIVSITPAHLVFNGPQASGNLVLKGLAPGSTILRMTVPPAYLSTAAPLVVSVSP